MITKEQIGALSKYYQIDGFTIWREYLQLLFLSYLYREKLANKIYFKGGTALRFFFNSSRFSEDLDFSTIYQKVEIERIIKKVEKAIQKELPEVIIIPLYIGRKTSRFRLKYQATDFKYPLVVRLDFNHIRVLEKIVVSPLVTKFPLAIFPLVSHLSEREILAEKISALATRGKGRDFFDVWFLLEKGIKIDRKLVTEKLSQAGRKFNKKSLAKKIRAYSSLKLNRDLAQFLPRSQREITTMLKERLLKYFTHFSHLNRHQDEEGDNEGK